MIDATGGVTAADATMGGYAQERSQRDAVVNNWDAVTTGKSAADWKARLLLKYLNYVTVIFFPR